MDSLMLVAAVEAIGALRWRPEAIRMLPLGCTKEDFVPPSGGGLRRRAKPAAQVFLQGQSSGAVGGAYLLLGDRPNATERVPAGSNRINGTK